MIYPDKKTNRWWSTYNAALAGILSSDPDNNSSTQVAQMAAAAAAMANATHGKLKQCQRMDDVHGYLLGDCTSGFQVAVRRATLVRLTEEKEMTWEGVVALGPKELRDLKQEAIRVVDESEQQPP